MAEVNQSSMNTLAPLPSSSSVTPSAPVDPFSLLLADKRSPATRRAYRQALINFFGREPTPEDVLVFVSLPRPQIALRLAAYKAGLLEAGAAEATINLRLAAVRSLLKLCFRLGYAEVDGRGLIDSERVKGYRNTRGIDLPKIRSLLATPGVDDLKGLRDSALLRPLCENGLRRSEVVALNVGDYSEADRRLMVLGKGRGTQKEPVSLSDAAAAAITNYLQAAGHGEDLDGPLFRNVSHRPDVRGGRVTANGLYSIVKHYGKMVGVPNLRPHGIRHGCITAALDATGGDVRRVQKLSRHAQIQTVVLYDDNRTDVQGGLSRLLSGLLDAEG